MILTHSIVLDLPKKDILLLGSKSSEAAKCWNCAVSLAYLRMERIWDMVIEY